ncbi:MAG: Trep_Strep domain-containing protein [Lachnospiraceae bacterium]|nr:Trep_Strep domain-containing protein [Lachnospiraceae bacterium]
MNDTCSTLHVNLITVHAYVFYSLYVVNGNLLMNLTGESSVIRAINARGGMYMFGRMLPIWAVILLLFIIQDAVAWHVIPVIVIAVMSEVVRAIFKYNRMGDVIGTVIMTFSSFGYYGQIWFNRNYTYECAVEEMPAGYADGLMAASPMWSLIVVIIVGVVLSVVISNLTAKLFKLEK